MSDFTPEGRTKFPPLHTDNERVGEFSEWPTEVLEDRMRLYESFLQGNPMPRAKETAGRIVSHLVFELLWRDGQFSDYREDELCDGNVE